MNENRIVREQPDEQVDRLVDEFTDRLNLGERPTVEEYVRKYPALAEILRELLGSLLALKSGADSSAPPQRSSVSLPSGTQVGAYTIHGEIARGGMAVVYLAHHAQLDRQVALKISAQQTRPDNNSSSLAPRFEREARSVAALHHPNIVPIYEAGYADGFQFIAMQLIEGSSLAEAVTQWSAASKENKSQGEATRQVDTRNENKASADTDAETPQRNRRPPREIAESPFLEAFNPNRSFRRIARLSLQIAEAISCAHASGILHRDIKPSNILLDAEDHIWVSDFGLAIHQDEDSTEFGNLTSEGDIVGTLRYMAPERFDGKCDVRSDVYGVGITLYELLTLRSPFDATERVHLISQVVSSPLTSPRSINPSIPQDLEAILRKATSRDPEARYQTAHELAMDLKRFLAYEPVLARSASPASRISFWCRRNPALATLSFALLITFCMGTGLFLWQFRQTRKANQQLTDANEQLSEANAKERAAREESERNAAVNLAVTEFMQKILRSPDPALEGRSVTVASQLDIAFEDLKGKDDLAPEIRGSLLYSIGESFGGLGLFNEATAAFQLSDEVFSQVLAEDAAKRLRVVSELGFAYVQSGKVQEAEDILLPAWERSLAALGENALESQILANHLSLVYHAGGEPQRAVELLEPIYAHQLQHRGLLQEATLQTINNLALVYQRTGKIAEAVALFEQAVEGDTELFGEVDPRTLMAKNNLAVAYLALRKPEKALPLVEETLKQRRLLLGEQHAETLGTENSLAGVYMMTGKVDQAVETLASLLPRMQAKLGAEHPNTLGIQYNLAGGYLTLDDYQQALPLFEKSHEQMKGVMGETHPTTLKCLRHVGLTHMKLQQFEQASSTFKGLVDVERSRDVVQPERLATALGWLAEAKEMLGEAEIAEALRQEALQLSPPSD